MSFIGPITNSIIDNVVQELNKKETKEKIMLEIIDPLIKDMSSRYYPYFMIIIIIMLIVIILLVAILIINIVSIKK
jgi:hypothetical protein